MNRDLWGNMPHSSVTLDSSSILDKLKNSKQAMSLITKKDMVKKPLEIIAWIKQALELLGQTYLLATQKNESVVFLQNVIKGTFDGDTIGHLLYEMEGNIEQLEVDNILSGKIAQIAHAAITHWAELEVKADV